MSKYTVELNEYLLFITDYQYNREDYDNVISHATSHIFNFDYHFINEGAKDKLEKQILNHFYFRELGYETVGLWHNRFRNKFLQIIEQYERLATTEIEGLFDTVFMKSEGKSKSNSNSSGQGQSNNVNKFSDTPQGGLQGIENNNYLTTVTMNDDNSSSQSTANGSSEFENITHGRNGDALIERYQKLYDNKMLSVNMLIINELEELFMQIW